MIVLLSAFAFRKKTLFLGIMMMMEQVNVDTFKAEKTITVIIKYSLT